MRILALHPWGTSAQLFERQIAPLVTILGSTHEFVYVNGPVEGIKASSVPDFVQGPFYRWYEGLSSPNVHEAHEFLRDVIEDEGPFDGVVGFSQGSSLVLSLLLQHELHSSAKPPPFRFAIFFCAVVVISPDKNFNDKYMAKYGKYYKKPELDTPGHSVASGAQNITDDIQEMESEHKDKKTDTDEVGKKSSSRPKSAPKYRGMLLLRSQREALTNELVDLVSDMTSLDSIHNHHKDEWQTSKAEDFPRIFHPLTIKERVHIPTVHVYGKNDPLASHSALAVRLCDKKRSKTIVFEGGHSLPTSLSDLRAVATAMEWAMQISLYT